MNKEEFEKFSVAWDRQLLSWRLQIRNQLERDETLVRHFPKANEQDICDLRDANVESIKQGNFQPLIDAFAEKGKTFKTNEEAEEFIKEVALERKREEKR